MQQIARGIFGCGNSAFGPAFKKQRKCRGRARNFSKRDLFPSKFPRGLRIRTGMRGKGGIQRLENGRHGCIGFENFERFFFKLHVSESQGRKIKRLGAMISAGKRRSQSDHRPRVRPLLRCLVSNLAKAPERLDD